jgi:hypothetical protein
MLDFLNRWLWNISTGTAFICIVCRYHSHNDCSGSVLFYSVLFYSFFILFCSVIFCSILLCFIILYSIRLCSILFYSVLAYSVHFYAIVFYYIVFCYCNLFCSFWHALLLLSILFCSVLFSFSLIKLNRTEPFFSAQTTNRTDIIFVIWGLHRKVAENSALLAY